MYVTLSYNFPGITKDKSIWLVHIVLNLYFPNNHCLIYSNLSSNMTFIKWEQLQLYMQILSLSVMHIISVFPGNSGYP